MKKITVSVCHADKRKQVKLSQYEDIDEAIRCLGSARVEEMINRQYRVDQLNEARRDWEKLPSSGTTEKTEISGGLISTLMRAIAMLMEQEADIYLHDFIFDADEEELVVTTEKGGEEIVILIVPY